MGKDKNTVDTIAGQYSKETLYYLLHRRSVSRKKLENPGPTDSELRQILTAASRVPDHGKMSPFWFMIFRGQDKDAFTNVLKSCLAEDKPKKDEEALEKTASKIMAPPLAIAVISAPKPSKIPVWEQFMTVGAACQNLVLSANALGYGVNWLTEWYSYDPRIKDALKLDEGENIAGFFFIGTAQDVPSDRERPDIGQITTFWHPENMVVKKGDTGKTKNKTAKASTGFTLPAYLSLNSDEEI